MDVKEVENEGPGKEYVTRYGIKLITLYLAISILGSFASLVLLWPLCETVNWPSSTVSDLTVTSISPGSGTIKGGTLASIRGTGFTDGVAVNFGETAAEDVRIVDSTFLRVRSPAYQKDIAHEKDLVDIIVISPDKKKSRTLVPGFLYVDSKDPQIKPSISSVTPDSGPLTGRQSVTITGAGFQKVTTVSFGSLPGIIKSQDAKTLIVTTPPHGEGKVDVAVTAEDTAILSNGYAYTCWSIKSSPSLLTIVIFAGALGGCLHALRSLIYYVGQRNLQVNWLPKYYLLPFEGAAMAVMFFLAASAGFYTVQATGNLILIGLSALVGMFSAQAAEKLKCIAEGLLTTPKKPSSESLYQEVVVTSMEPKSGSTHGNTEVMVIGKGFDDHTIVRFGENDATVKKPVNQGFIVAITPAHAAGKVNVFVINKKNGQFFTVPDVYEYVTDLGTPPKSDKDELLHQSEGDIK